MTTHAFPGPQAPSWRCTRCGCLPTDKLGAFPCMPDFTTAPTPEPAAVER